MRFIRTSRSMSSGLERPIEQVMTQRLIQVRPTIGSQQLHDAISTISLRFLPTSSRLSQRQCECEETARYAVNKVHHGAGGGCAEADALADRAARVLGALPQEGAQAGVRETRCAPHPTPLLSSSYKPRQ